MTHTEEMAGKLTTGEVLAIGVFGVALHAFFILMPDVGQRMVWIVSLGMGLIALLLAVIGKWFTGSSFPKRSPGEHVAVAAMIIGIGAASFFLVLIVAVAARVSKD